MSNSLPASLDAEEFFRRSLATLGRYPLSDWEAILNEENGLVDSESPEELGDAVGRKALNGTAYRIFKLLQWLIQSPMNLKTLNARFCADSRIGRAVSNDSVWLYINTLKALGCSIRRPSPKNGFCYELLSHPFGLSLSEARRETLARAKAHVQKSFSHQEMLVLDRLLKKIIRHSTVSMPQAGIDELFRQTRSADLETCQEHIRQLESGLPHETLFRLRYHSPVQGEESFFFIPEMLYYEQGVMYARGDRENNIGSSSLRVDRIIALETVDDEERRAKIQRSRSPQVEVRLRIFTPEPMNWNGLELQARHGIYEERLLSTFNKRSISYVEIVLQVRDFFYLQQRLLACGYPFQVLSPVSFREEIQATLQTMLQFYHIPDDPVPDDPTFPLLERMEEVSYADHH